MLCKFSGVSFGIIAFEIEFSSSRTSSNDPSNCWRQATNPQCKARFGAYRAEKAQQFVR